jgi:hypothetical protein
MSKLVSIYNTLEAFKYGWVAGLYDALADDGLRYTKDILPFARGDANEPSYLAGYRSGRQARLGPIAAGQIGNPLRIKCAV